MSSYRCRAVGIGRGQASVGGRPFGGDPRAGPHARPNPIPAAGRSGNWSARSSGTQIPMSATCRATIPSRPVESDINPLMFAGVGGSATLYAAHWTPFLPSDSGSKRSTASPRTGPSPTRICYRSSPDRARGRRFRHSREPGLSAARHPSDASTADRQGRAKGGQGLDRLGWHWWPGTNAIPSMPYNGLNACVPARNLYDRDARGR